MARYLQDAARRVVVKCGNVTGGSANVACSDARCKRSNTVQSTRHRGHRAGSIHRLLSALDGYEPVWLGAILTEQPRRALLRGHRGSPRAAGALASNSGRLPIAGTGCRTSEALYGAIMRPISRGHSVSAQHRRPPVKPREFAWLNPGSHNRGCAGNRRGSLCFISSSSFPRPRADHQEARVSSLRT